MKICDGVYAYIWKGIFENNSNAFYFAEPLNILFDPGLKNHVDARLSDMEKDGLNPADIKYIINTHCHPDHFEGTLNFLEKDVQIGMHEEEIEFYNQEGPAFFRMFGMPFPDIKFDVVLKEGIWKVGDTELEVIHTPGHSPGSVCIYWKEKKAMACGDLVFEESFGRVDFPGGDGRKLVESINKISQMDIEILLPGHMNMIVGKDNVVKNFDIISKYFSIV
ncbi:MAG: MBL fold metallo-hydrolase [bacterium]|nr:MBL fold metallo-hydrolase [bacterium]